MVRQIAPCTRFQTMRLLSSIHARAVQEGLDDIDIILLLLLPIKFSPTCQPGDAHRVGGVALPQRRKAPES